MNEPSFESSSPRSAELIREFLHSHHSGVLATAEPSGQPHAAVVYYSVDDIFCLTFATKTGTQKYKNMEQNNRVAFACYDEATQTTVQISGYVEKITEASELQNVVSRMYRSSESISGAELPPAEKMFAGDYTAFKLLPQTIRMAVFIRPDAESNEELFETLTFAR